MNYDIFVLLYLLSFNQAQKSYVPTFFYKENFLPPLSVIYPYV